MAMKSAGALTWSQGLITITSPGSKSGLGESLE